MRRKSSSNATASQPAIGAGLLLPDDFALRLCAHIGHQPTGTAFPRADITLPPDLLCWYGIFYSIDLQHHRFAILK
jgi:hypothetical protein